ncbi:hypothetical protein KFE94_15250 [bacterium SCSIO 12643]|nr:hypothetical protein KFE94_15250 [bacterium SCSIO 12643]
MRKIVIINRAPEWNMRMASEAFTAGFFARLGYKISKPHGIEDSHYNFKITLDENEINVAVKGSQDGLWRLTQDYVTRGKRDYIKAAERWFSRFGPHTIFSLVQFKDVEKLDAPRIYLATPKEIFERLKNSSSGKGGCNLYENKVWVKKASGYGTTDKVPENWMMTESRIKSLCKSASLLLEKQNA